MITDKTLDQALVEIMRTKKALEALRKARKGVTGRMGELSVKSAWTYREQMVEHAAAKRASLDLTRKLAALRAGR
jgi:hypothetical protein